jgi:predicted permease
MEALLHDLRYAVRTLLRTPGWTIMAVLTLAIGTGANAAVFSFVDALLFKPAPGVQAARPLVFVYTSDFSSGPYGASSYPDYRSLREDTAAFAALSAIDDSLTTAVRVGDGLQRVRLARVSGDYFATLGVRMSEGRSLAETDLAPSAAPVAVIGSALRRRAFSGQPSVAGSIVTLDGRAFTIVGVAPPRFTGIDVGRPIEIWTPLDPHAGMDRGSRTLHLVGQLRDGVSEASARAQVAAVAGRLAADFPASNRGTLDRPDAPREFTIAPAARLVPAQRALVMRLAAVLTGGVGLVLLLACANVAGLLLARTTTRNREIAVRRALGAAAPRLLRQFLTESAVLALAAAAAGLIFAAWTADVLASFFPAEQAMAIDVSPGLRTAVFAVALAGVSALLVGIVPAARALSPPLAASLRGAAGDITERTGSRVRAVLVAGQVAIACVLLVAAALLAQSVYHELHADFGFSTRDALLVDVDVPAGLGEAHTRMFYDEARARVAALPGVESAAWMRVPPFTRPSRRQFTPEGYMPSPGEDLELASNVVSPEYFSALGVQVTAGRAFEPSDGAAAPRVAIVNASLAARFFADGQAVGRHLVDSAGTANEIVGVVRTGKGVTVMADAPPTVYSPLAQTYSPGSMSLVARTTGRPERLADAVRRAVQSANADVPVARVITLRGHVEESLSAERLSASIVSACGVLAALLAVVGLYGAVAYLVTRRTREIGVRIALGAQPRHVVLLVLRHGLGMAAAGVVVGVAAAAAGAMLLRSLLYGVGPASPFTHAAVAVLLLVVAALAAYVPARRAVRIDPARALSQS